MKKILIMFIGLLMLNACGANVWNSGDLHKWVLKEATKFRGTAMTCSTFGSTPLPYIDLND